MIPAKANNSVDDRVLAVADISDTNAVEMRERLLDMKQRLSLVQSFFKEVMIKNQDYGVIPGTDKPSLLKPGAEKLCEFYGFAIQCDVEADKDKETGYAEYTVTVSLISKKTGHLVAQGVGEANTMESRYRWRWVWEKDVPEGVDKSTLKTRTINTRRGPAKQYRIENDDPWSLWNTVLKMAKKRALVDAVLSATRSSGIFTQDIEDLEGWAENGEVIVGEAEPVYEEPPKPEENEPAHRQSGNGRQPGKREKITAKLYSLMAQKFDARQEHVNQWLMDLYGVEAVDDIKTIELAKIVKNIEDPDRVERVVNSYGSWYNENVAMDNKEDNATQDEDGVPFDADEGEGTSDIDDDEIPF